MAAYPNSHRTFFLAAGSLWPISTRRFPHAWVQHETWETRNAQPACFNRQIGMYLARHVARWSTTVIGRFYNGRDHWTVCHGIQRIETLRENDPDVDALISGLEHELSSSGNSPVAKPGTKAHRSLELTHRDLQTLADLIAERVYAPIKKRAVSYESGLADRVSIEH
jgi:hypothetical protein